MTDRKIRAYDAEMLAHTSPEMSSGPWTYVAQQEGGSTRWTQWHTLVVRHEDGTLWGLDYETGLTEYQELNYPWEKVDDDHLLGMSQLYRVDQVVTRYVTDWQRDRHQAGQVTA
jgi:hypothetical protein